MSTVCELPAIDVHGHYGQYAQPGTHPLKERFMSGDPAVIVARAKASGIWHTVVSPLRALLPRGQADAVAGNEEARRVVDETDGLLQWVVLNPLQLKTFE